MTITQINTHRRNRHGSWRDGEGGALNARRLPSRPAHLYTRLGRTICRRAAPGSRRPAPAKTHCVEGLNLEFRRSCSVVSATRPADPGRRAQTRRSGGPTSVVSATRPADQGWRAPTLRSGGPTSVVSATRPADPGWRAPTRRSGGPVSVVSATRPDDPGRRAPTRRSGGPLASYQPLARTIRGGGPRPGDRAALQPCSGSMWPGETASEYHSLPQRFKTPSGYGRDRGPEPVILSFKFRPVSRRFNHLGL